VLKVSKMFGANGIVGAYGVLRPEDVTTSPRAEWLLYTGVAATAQPRQWQIPSIGQPLVLIEVRHAAP